jgi:hypothetical protein
MKELLAVLLMLAPPTPKDPAPISFQLPVNTKAVSPDGKVYIFTGTLQVTIEDPIPVPVNPTITAVKNEAGLGVLEIRSGEVLVLEGVKLWQEGVSLRVQIPGRTATLLSASPTKLTVRFPAVTAPMEGPLQLYQNSGSGWTLVTTGPKIKVLPVTVGTFRLRSFATPDGTPQTRLDPREPFLIQGEGFGVLPGEVTLGTKRARVTAWSDTEIRVDGPEWAPERGFGSNPWWPEEVSVWRPDWEQPYSLGRAVYLLEPGQEVLLWPPITQNR